MSVTGIKGPVANSWQEVPGIIDSREAKATHVAHGIVRGKSAKEVWVDFGGDSPISLAQITFRDKEAAQLAYCNGVRLEVKVVTNPEHEEV